MRRREEKDRLRRRQEVESLVAPVTIVRPDSPRNLPPEACPTCLGAGFLRQDLPFGHPEFGKAIPCPDCNWQDPLVALKRRSQLDGWLTSATFANFYERGDDANAEAFSTVMAFAERRVGWLVLYGGFGEGKTHLLAAVVNACIAAKVAAVYFTCADLLAELRACYGADSDITEAALFQKVRDVPVLALDEVNVAAGETGMVKVTEWVKAQLFRLLDARHRRRGELGTIIAMNAQPGELRRSFGYLYSRMQDTGCQVIEMSGGDARGLFE